MLGQKSTLKCEVLDAYPTEHLHIEWLQGESVLETHDGDADSESVLTTYTFTPTLEDTGKRITCRAKHGLEAVPSDEKIRETTVSLTVLCKSAVVSCYSFQDCSVYTDRQSMTYSM